MIPYPLLLLIWLRLGAGWRRFLRGLRKPKNLIAFLVVAVFMALAFLPSFVPGLGRRPGAGPLSSTLEDLAPLIILGLLLLSIVGSRSDQALAFLQAEVDLLFPAPFTRVQL